MSSPVINRLSPSLLTPAQREAILEVQRRKKVSIWSRPGSGKTVVTLTALSDLLLTRPALVVATKRIVDLVWEQEAQRWDHLQHLTFTRLSGRTPAQREKLLEDPGDIVLINYELLVWLTDHLVGPLSDHFSAIVFDEISKMGRPGTRRFRNVRHRLRGMPIRIGMTGTPRGNSMIKLWGQMYCIGGKKPLGPTMLEYRREYFMPVDSSERVWHPKRGRKTEARITRKVAPWVLSMSLTADDVVMNMRTIPVALPAKARTQYEQLASDLRIVVEGRNILALEDSHLSNKLQQISGGAVYLSDDPKREEYAVLHTAKIDALEEIVEEAQDEQLIVFFAFKHELHRIQQAFGKSVATVDQVGDWLAGRYQILALHPACLHPSTEVLTEHRGWVPIVDVKADERVHDGVEFVSHDGCSFSGIAPVITRLGITMTHGHKLLINNEWVEAQHVLDSEKQFASVQLSRRDDASGRVLPPGGMLARGDLSVSGQARNAGGGSGRLAQQHIPQRSEVYDLVNCGPRHRFLIRNADGDVFISHNSAGHGLNLHVGGCALAVWFSIPVSAELWEQANRRLNRKGQTQVVNTLLLTADTQVERDRNRALTRHMNLQDAMMDALAVTSEGETNA